MPRSGRRRRPGRCAGPAHPTVRGRFGSAPRGPCRGRSGEVAQGRTTQHELACVAADSEGEVRLAAPDQLDGRIAPTIVARGLDQSGAKAHRLDQLVVHVAELPTELRTDRRRPGRGTPSVPRRARRTSVALARMADERGDHGARLVEARERATNGSGPVTTADRPPPATSRNGSSSSRRLPLG